MLVSNIYSVEGRFSKDEKLPRKCQVPSAADEGIGQDSSVLAHIQSCTVRESHTAIVGYPFYQSTVAK